MFTGPKSRRVGAPARLDAVDTPALATGGARERGGRRGDVARYGPTLIDEHTHDETDDADEPEDT